MTDSIKQFLKLVESSNKILVTSHISPDPDAICSVLLMGTTLKFNYPEKRIEMVMEEEADGLDYLEGYPKIGFETLDSAINSRMPQLIILVDGPSKYERFSRHGALKIREYLAKFTDTKVVVIDHHEPETADKVDVFINRRSVATVQEVYELLFSNLKLKRPKGFGFTTMLGLYSDSGGFIYDNPRQQEMLLMVGELLKLGVSLEEVSGRLNSYTDDHIEVLKELFGNLSHLLDYSYSFISDDFADKWLKAKKDPRKMFTACGQFSDQYIRHINNRRWGFLVRPDITEGPGNYSVSFRSQSGVVDVSKIAKRLGGGGHIPAAGARFKAKSFEEAIDVIQRAISKTL